MSDVRTTSIPSNDPLSDALSQLLGAVLLVGLSLVALPLLIPFVANAVVPDIVATRTSFWKVYRWQWAANTIGILLVAVLVAVEALLLTDGSSPVGLTCSLTVTGLGNWFHHLVAGLS